MVEAKLKMSLDEQGVAVKDRIRATFNFDDHEEKYSPPGFVRDDLDLQKTLPTDYHDEDDDPHAGVEEEKDMLQFMSRTHKGGECSEDEAEVEDDTLAKLVDREEDDKKEEKEKENDHLSSPATVAVSVDISKDYVLPVHDESGNVVVYPQIKRFRNVFAVVADPSLYRVYQWGTCSVVDTLHSDFPILRRLLFQPKTMDGMINETRK